MSAIEFYFDFSSPYGYLTSTRIDEMAARHGRSVDWKPYLMGVVMKQTGAEPLLNVPMKGDYARYDLARSARRMKVPFVLPAPFPFASIAACRAFYALADEESGEARRLAEALYGASFARGLDVSQAEGVLEIAAELGLDRDALAAAMQDQSVKDRLRREVEAAIGRGVFGSPYLIVDGEPFWGHDRLVEVEAWLESGGW